MKTNQEWEEQARTFYDILEKIDLKELELLTSIFECYPSYSGEVTKPLCIYKLWAKLRDWRLGTDRAVEMKNALSLLVPPR